MSYAKSTIIQLREREGIGRNVDTDNNGDYSVVIDPVTLEEGDVVSLKSAFIDSVSSSSGKIIVTEEERDLTISFYHYILNWDTANKQYNEGEATSAQQPDGKHYFLCDTRNVTGNSRLIKTITIHELPNYGTRYWGGKDVVMHFKYTPAGQTTQEPTSVYPLRLGEIHGESGVKTYKDVDVRINGDFPFQLSEDSEHIKHLREAHVDTNNIQTTRESMVDGSYKTAHQFKITANIPSGTYDPDELARVINDAFSKLDNTSDLYISGIPMKNDLLTTASQFSTATGAGGFANVKYASDDGQDFYNYTAGEYLSGTSQFGIEYDDELSKFKFTIINNPYYDSSQIAIRSFQQAATGNYFIANKNSGIVFCNLEPNPLWFEKMGFDANKILVHPTENSRTIGAIGNQSLPVFSGTATDTFTPIKEGDNMTGSYKGLDVVINKTNNPAGDPNAQQALAVENISAASLTQNIIFANKSVQQTQYAYGYYMVEVEMGGLNQELIGRDFKSNKIRSILGRYYSNNSYTSGYNEGSIPYVHRGAPTKLSNFKVRLLKDDGTLADDIGDNNTVFIQIDKQGESAMKF